MPPGTAPAGSACPRTEERHSTRGARVFGISAPEFGVENVPSCRRGGSWRSRAGGLSAHASEAFEVVLGTSTCPSLGLMGTRAGAHRSSEGTHPHRVRRIGSGALLGLGSWASGFDPVEQAVDG